MVVFSAACERQPVPLTIIYSGNLDGELEPCGCSDLGNFGGIKRRVTILDQLRQSSPNLVALSSGGLLSSDGAGDQLKSKYILQGFKSFKYDAVGMQWIDLAYGVEFARQDDVPWVVSNGVDQTLVMDKKIERNISGQNVVVKFFAWLDPDQSPSKQMAGDHAMVSNDVKNIIQALAKADQEKMLTVLSTSMSLEEVNKLLPLDHVDVLLVKSAYEEFSEPKKMNNTLVLQPGSRGMRIARLDIELTAKGKIKQWKHTVISMPESVPDAKRMLPWYEEYNAAVKEDYLKRVAIRKQRMSGSSDYMGEEKCQVCHPAQYAIWQNSEHAKAFDDLESVNKSFDPACIKCHTVGFNQPGGFVDINITSHLLAVQCENCHGPSRDHVQSSGKSPVANAKWSAEKMCLQCHIQKHSPGFQLDAYWPKIAHKNQ